MVTQLQVTPNPVQPRRRNDSRLAQLPIVAINNSGSVTKANAPALKALGTMKRQVEGANVGSLLASLLRRGRDARAQTSLSFLDPDGKREDVLVVLSDAPRSAGEPNGTSANANLPADGLERRNMDFMAHELRNPLATIVGLSRVLETRSDSLQADDRKAAIETIHSEADRCLLILESVLRLAESQSDSVMPLANVPLHAVARRVIEAQQHQHPHRQITLSGDSPLYARANSTWVELALANLLANAEKFTPADRSIEVALHQNGSRSTILVIDNGTSLAPESYDALWEMYHRDPRTSAGVRGAGIGLALCKQLIEAMGGHVWAGPRRPGGSVFAVSLPAPWEAALDQVSNVAHP